MELCKNEHVHWGTKHISSFSVATLNICAIPLITKKIKSRFNNFLSAISHHTPQFVSIQEAYAPGPLKMLCRTLALSQYQTAYSGLRWLFHRGGLATFSLSPIIESKYFPFKNQGKLLSAQFSDRIAGKGFLFTKTASVYHINTHLTADYSDSKDIKNTLNTLETQKSQLSQILNFVSKLSGMPIILTGDFNFTPESILYREILSAFFKAKRTKGQL
jgi:endonuclease/exonuclease/phosphatase (EEP) superfamily protein YafD